MDFEAIKKAAQAYGPDMTRFLRDMIAIPSESCEEKGVAHRIAEEMKKLGYDKVEFDALGKRICSKMLKPPRLSAMTRPRLTPRLSARFKRRSLRRRLRSASLSRPRLKKNRSLRRRLRGAHLPRRLMIEPICRAYGKILSESPPPCLRAIESTWLISWGGIAGNLPHVRERRRSRNINGIGHSLRRRMLRMITTLFCMEPI